MSKVSPEYSKARKITLWVDSVAWRRLGLIVGDRNRSDEIRQFMDRFIARNIEILEEKEKQKKTKKGKK